MALLQKINLNMKILYHNTINHVIQMMMMERMRKRMKMKMMRMMRVKNLNLMKKVLHLMTQNLNIH